MFCDYCRQLFELRQKAERYEPQHKGLAGTSSTSAPWSQPQLQQDSDEEREWSKETYKAKLESIRRGEKPASRPKIEIYEDVEDLFTPRLLWWKIPIRKDGLKAGYSHTPNADCQVCQMIFSNISPSLIDVLLKKNDKEEDGMAFVYQLKSTVNSKRMVAGNEAILSISLEFGKELLPMVRLQVMRRLRNPLYLTYNHVESTNTGSKESLALAASWIRECNLNHPRCSVSRNRGRQLPSRLVHVGTSDGSQNPHLWIPDPESTFVQYAALSYRWSPSPKVVLTKASQASLCKEIPIHLLPQSNQDAIQITRYLGLKYLWIDALCILQDLDDPSDWLRESARMGDIYKFAYVTVSASQASNGKAGCFSEHQPLEARLVTTRSLTTTSGPRKPGLEAATSVTSTASATVTDDLTSVSTWSRFHEASVEAGWAYSEKEPRWQEFEEKWEKHMNPVNTSMLSAEETILEMLVRQEILHYPDSKILRTMYEGLRQIQNTREQEAHRLNSGHASKDLISHSPTNVLTVSSKRVGTFSLSEIKGIERNDSYILGQLRRSFSDIEEWRKSNFTLTRSSANARPFSIFAKFIRMDDVSLLSLEEKTQEKILRMKMAQDPANKSLHYQYNQLRDYQRQRESIRDATKADIVIKTLQTDLWTTEVDASPLSRRAWTLQERLLSTRVLHFTQSQIFWECESVKACETWPEPESKGPSTDEFAESPSTKTVTRPLDGVTLTPLEEHWEEIVELYTDANLTREEDKLVAISSLANTIQQKTDDQYHAGLWRKTFSRNLLFCVELPQKPAKFKYRAPSWSWASMNSKVNFLCKDSAHGIIPASSITSIWTIGLDGKRASTGQIQDGSFNVSASTSQILRQEKRGMNYWLVFSDELSDCDTSAEYFPDTRIDTVPKEALCLPIVYYKEMGKGTENNGYFWLAGLVLLPTGEFRDEFRRLGVFRMVEDGGRCLFDRVEWRSITVV